MAKILIVEDEILMVNALRRKLESAGFRVLTARTGRDGLEMALEQHPDLVLLDLILPEMDGMEVLKKLRSDEWGKDVRVLIVTNMYDPYKIKEAKTMGVKEYLVKTDWSLSQIAKKIEENLKKK